MIVFFCIYFINCKFNAYSIAKLGKIPKTQ
jgi:hypothetical protein